MIVPIKIFLLLLKSSISGTFNSQLRESILAFEKFDSHKLYNPTIQRLKFQIILRATFVNIIFLKFCIPKIFISVKENHHKHPVSILLKSSLIK